MVSNLNQNNNLEQRPYKDFESLLTKRIYDDVHGFVSLTEDEKQLLSHPYMKRLHFIKQNALAYFVFPGATHTRFSHSIGVLHIVEKMIQKLKTLGKEKIDITPMDHQVVRLAALLHDVGHYPLSHTIESCFQDYDIHFLQQKYKQESIINQLNEVEENTFFDNLKTEVDVLKDFPIVTAGASKFHHEKIADILINHKKSPLRDDVVKILKNTYQKVFQQAPKTKQIEIYLGLIGKLICGNLDLYDEQLKDKTEQDKYFILSLLINSDLDADQMDYMSRDTKNTGIQTTIRIDFLIDNMDICYIKIQDRFQPVLCFDYKAIESVQQFILSKEYWYTEIIFYDKVSILNRIAQRLYMYSLYKENNINSIEDFYEKILFKKENYVRFIDSEFWNRIYNLSNDKNIPKKLERLIKILLEKEPIPRALTGNRLSVVDDTEIRKYFRTSINPGPITKDKKRYVYQSINRTFKEKFPKQQIFPMFFSNKFFNPATAENPTKEYANRSIYILLSPCDKDSCDKKCLNAAGLLDTDKIGQNIIHKLLENITSKGARIEKCLVYNFAKQV